MHNVMVKCEIMSHELIRLLAWHGTATNFAAKAQNEIERERERKTQRNQYFMFSTIEPFAYSFKKKKKKQNRLERTFFGSAFGVFVHVSKWIFSWK